MLFQNDEQPISFNRSRIVVIAGVILIVVILLLVTIAALLFRNGSNLTSENITTTIPEQCINVICPPGLKGNDGKDAMCLANPVCQKGDKGDDGNDGNDAVCQTCPRGLTGKDGKDATCLRDCEDGKPGTNGTCTEPCVNGTQGIPGICNCFNITSIEFDDLTINDSLQLNGTIQCAAGTTIDPGCLTVGACPDFSPCDLQAKSLLLDGGTPTRLQMGSFGAPATGEVLLGDPTLGITDRIINYIRGYANSVYLKSRYNMILQAGVSSSVLFDIVATGGISSILQLRSSGNVIVESENRVDQIASNIHQISVLPSVITTSPVAHLVDSQTITLRSNNLRIEKKPNIGSGGSNWFDMSPLSSYDCSVTPPVIVPGDPSTNVYEDQIHHPQSRVLTNNPDGFLRITNLELTCEGGRIRSGPLGSNPLSIESAITNSNGNASVCIDDLDGLDLKDTFIYSSTTNQTDIRGTIMNGDGPVCIDDLDGLDLKDTYIYSSTTNQTDIRGIITNNDVNASLCIDDPEGLDLKDTDLYSSTTNNVTIRNSDTLVVNTILGPGSLTINGITFSETGDITTTGTITAGMVDAGAGSCCTSDLRMKHSITAMNTTTSLHRIIKLNPIEYRWKKELLVHDKSLEDVVVRGFGAQHVDSIIPRAVRKRRRRIGNDLYNDFHYLDKVEMIPDLIAAVQELYKENLKLRELVLNK